MRFFTKHSCRVLDDPDRLDAAWGQIAAEYKRFLADEYPAAGSMRRCRIAAGRWSRPRTTVLLQLGRRGLSGGLYRRGDGPLTSIITKISEVLWRCYLRSGREGSKPPHKPPHEDFLLATRDGEYDPFVERRMCRAGDDVLLLIPEVPESCSQAWLDDAESCLFVDDLTRYRPSIQSHRPGWEPLHGLPAGWLALRFKTREDLSAVSLRGKWIGAVNRATRLRVVGGLTLRRGVWMLGAGPKIQVVGPGSYDHLLVDGEPLPLDDTRCATLDLAVGKHRVCLPDSRSRTLQFWVRKPRRAAPLELAGWYRAECGWPASAGESRRIEDIPGSDTLHGTRLNGHWPARNESEPGLDVKLPRTTNGGVPDEFAAMILALRLRAGGRLSPTAPQLPPGVRAVSARGVNPLIRGMIRANRSSIVRRTDKV